MPHVFVRGGTNSGLAVPAAGLFYKVLVETPETSANQNVDVGGGGATANGYAFTQPGIPGVDGATGNYIVELDLPTSHANIAISVAVARVNSSGTQQAISAFTAEQTGVSGVSIYNLAAVNLGVWAAGDRLRVTCRFRNTNTMNIRSVTIAHGSLNNEVTTPFAHVDPGNADENVGMR